MVAITSFKFIRCAVKVCNPASMIWRPTLVISLRITFASRYAGERRRWLTARNGDSEVVAGY